MPQLQVRSHWAGRVDDSPPVNPAWLSKGSVCLPQHPPVLLQPHPQFHGYNWEVINYPYYVPQPQQSQWCNWPAHIKYRNPPKPRYTYPTYITYQNPNLEDIISLSTLCKPPTPPQSQSCNYSTLSTCHNPQNPRYDDSSTPLFPFLVMWFHTPALLLLYAVNQPLAWPTMQWDLWTYEVSHQSTQNASCWIQGI